MDGYIGVVEKIDCNACSHSYQTMSFGYDSILTLDASIAPIDLQANRGKCTRGMILRTKLPSAKKKIKTISRLRGNVPRIRHVSHGDDVRAYGIGITQLLSVF